MAKNLPKINLFVGKKRADGTVYKLLNDKDLRLLLLDHIHGRMEVEELCKKHNLTKAQFHRQKYYRDRILEPLIKKVEYLLRVGNNNAGTIAWILNIPLEKMNKLIIEINDKEIEQHKNRIDIYAE